MIKTVCLVFLALVVVLLAAAGVAWKLNGERWQQEYAAFRKTGAPVLMYHAVGLEEGADWPKTLIMKPELFEAHLKYLKEQGYTIVFISHKLNEIMEITDRLTIMRGDLDRL